MFIAMALLEDIRTAIKASGVSRYRIAADTGIPESSLCRLMDGTRGLSSASLERLTEYLGLKVVTDPKRRRKKAR